jgi:hypothetical protein
MGLQLHVVAGPDAGLTLTLQEGADLMLGRAQSAFDRPDDPRLAGAGSGG